MDKPIPNVSTVYAGGRAFGHLIKPSPKMLRALELIVVKNTPFGSGHLREFITKQIKRPLLALLNLVADKLPEPTKENTWHPNSHKLLDLRDEYFQHDNTPSRKKAFKAIWNFVIIVYDYDWFYRERIDWVMGKLLQIDWKPYEGEEKPREPWWNE